MMTTTETVPIQPVGSLTPSIIARAPVNEYAKVLVRHVAGGASFVATDTQAICPAAGAPPSAKCFRIVPGAEEVFVLAPRQSLFAVGGGLLSVTVSGMIDQPR